MPDENRNGPESPNHAEVIEFNWPLYVYKKRVEGQTDHLYSIALWRGTTLVSICLLQPLDIAVAALADLLQKAGCSECVTAARKLSPVTPAPADGSGNISGHDAQQ